MKPGDRVRLTRMGPDPCPMPIGSEGTLRRVTELWDGMTQLVVDWDNGRSLMPILPEDGVEVIKS